MPMVGYVMFIVGHVNIREGSPHIQIRITGLGQKIL